MRAFNLVSKAIAAFVFALLVSSAALAQTSSTRSALEGQANLNITTNGNFAISGAELNALLNNMIASMATLLDLNNFTNAPKFLSITGSSQCLHVDTTGQLSGTGSDCGAGGAVASVANSDGTATVSPTTGSVVVSVALGHANVWTGEQTFGGVLGTVTTQNGTTYTFARADCGTEVDFTNAGAVTATIPQTLPLGCNIAVLQAGASKVSVNGSAVTPATLHSRPGYTGTAGQWAIIGINIEANSGGSAAVAILTGDGS